MEKLNRKTQIIILLSLFSLVVLILVIVYPILPAQIPMQYSLTGSVNRYADKFVAVLTAIGINGALFLYNFFGFKEKIPTKNFIVSIVLSVISVVAICASLLVQ
ncbi:MAG TPA: DUF1648 domain-containing protein [Erysipelotrichaceae bacterium]|nr:DUF1648 domain-containing protein [Erysipelotrichaceae bacterium]